MAVDARLICDSAALENSGKAVRFEVEYFGARAPAFVLRFEDRVYGYLNRCGRLQPLPMARDWWKSMRSRPVR